MKKVLFVLLLLCSIVCGAAAQIKDVSKYDSLSGDVKEDSLNKYIGQCIYTTKDKMNEGFLNFYKNLNGDAYYSNNANQYYDRFNCLTGRILKIKDLGKTISGEKYIQLIDDSNNEILYYIYGKGTDKDYYKPFILYGYYIKLKNMLQGYKCFDGYNRYKTCDSIFIDDDILSPEIKVKYSTGKIENAYPNIIRNSIAEKEFADLEMKVLNDKIKAEEERILNIKKYGWVKIGMRRNIILKVCGEPDKINTTTTRYGKFEQLIYDDKLYIYIENGRVSAIQDYR